MSPESLARSLASSQGWLARVDAAEGAIAVYEAGVAGDDERARRWVRRLLDDQSPDGDWDGDLVATADALLTLQELRSAAGLVEQDPGVGRGLAWLRARRAVPGSWGDGCTPDRHAMGLCHHFVGGFFAPTPPEVPLPEVRLRCGARTETDAEARFAASGIALRAMLAWEPAGTDARLHLETLRRVVLRWDRFRPDGLTTVGLASAVHALLASPVPEDRAAAALGVRIVAGRQRGDGSWVDADAFHALEVFGLASDLGVEPERTRSALWHGARLLVSTQHDDGSWGEDYGPRRALIAWRTFRRLERAGD